MNKKGFTLAEVLITLAAIGVVAALTLPSINTNTERSECQTATAKFYNNLQAAVDRYMAENNATRISETPFGNSTNFAADLIENTMQIKGRCSSVTDAGCFAAKYKTPSGTSVDNNLVFENSEIFTLPDGAVVYTSTMGSTAGLKSDVIVDINGPKRPNRIGWDCWTLTIYSDGIVDDGITAANRRAAKSGDFDIRATYQTNFATCLARNTFAANGCFGGFKLNNFKISR